MKLYWLFAALLAAAPLGAAPADKPFQNFLGAAYSKAAPDFDQSGKPWKFPYGPKVQIGLAPATVLRPVTPFQFGVNTACWSGKQFFNAPEQLEKAKEAGIRFWRWPGGSTSDNYFWNGDYSAHPRDHDGNDVSNLNQAWAVSTDDFMAFCQATGAEPIFTVNYAAARYWGLAQAADLAAGWVRYCNVQKGWKVRYWEIGNEVYGPWEEGNKMDGKPQLTGEMYGKDFQVIAAAMRQVDPGIFIGAVGVDTDSGDDWTGYHWWMKGLLPQLKGKADFLILHQYFMWPFDASNNYTHPSNEAFLSNLHKLADAKAALDQMIDRYAPSEKGIPVALTEFNLVNATPPETTELLNGVFTAEVLGESLKAGYAAADFWDWKNGLDKKLGGDHAMLASGDPSAVEGAPRATYYTYALYQRAFGSQLIGATSSDPQVKVYASLFSGGEVGLILVNEDGLPRTLTFDLGGFQPKGRLMGWVLSGKDLNDTQVSFNGEKAEPGGGPFPTQSIPPYQAHFNPQKGLAVPLPAYSVTGLVLY
ncbi:MAG TPA: hypothetical protein VMU88_05025 [bacterium]|nr:hypothetical protein [bacterium]